jgi:hypothetical protein
MNKVVFDQTHSHYVISFDYDPQIVSAVKHIPGRRYDGRKKIWTAPQSSAEAVITFAQAYGLTVDPSSSASQTRQAAPEPPSSPKSLLTERGAPDSNVLSYPERGPWGSASWRGNFSGYGYADLFHITIPDFKITPRSFVDPMVGSGTSIQVAEDMGIEAYGLDLHSGFNAVRDSILHTVGKKTDVCISHPPYHNMIQYSGNMYGEAHPDDLSRCEDVEEFYEKMTLVLLNQRHAVKTGGFYGTIVGDLRKKGTYHSLQAELQARMDRREYAATLIKIQHNVKSDQRSYRMGALPRIQTEYILLWKKNGPGMLIGLDAQIRSREQSTWKAVVKFALMQLGGQATLSQLYETVEKVSPERTKLNEHWREKIRQTVQLDQHIERVGKGTYRVHRSSSERDQEGR